MRIPTRQSGKFSTLLSDPLMTQKKFLELKDKLMHLRVQQPQAAQEVARLAELGDFSENTEYQMAKGRLRGINNAILNLEHQLYEAVLIPEKEIDNPTKIVRIGSNVTVVCKKHQKTFKILGATETDPARGVISYQSPLGQALLNHMVGDKVLVELSGQTIEYEIRAIN